MATRDPGGGDTGGPLLDPPPFAELLTGEEAGASFERPGGGRNGRGQEAVAVDVLVVGAGPAGLAAAIELRRLGVGRVLVVEREPAAGGVPRHCAHPGFGLRDLHRLLSGPRYAERYVRLARDAGVEILTETTATAWSGPTALSLTGGAGIRTVHARAVLLATGCRERPRAARLIPGTRPAGVLTTGALQQMVYLHRQPVGTRAVVLGAEHVSFSALLTLAHAGATTAAMVTAHRRHQSYAALRWLTATRARVPILTSSQLEAVHGRQRVEGVTVRDLQSGRVAAIACDTLVCTGDWIPDHELARRGGIAIDRGGGAPEVDLGLRTSRRGVFAAGNLLHGAETADVAALSGRHAAAAVRRYLDADAWPDRLPLRCAAPLRWISPGAVDGRTPPPHGRFILRTAEIAGGATLVVSQEGRELWRQRYRTLLPNRPIHLSAQWLARVDLAGPEPVFRILAE